MRWRDDCGALEGYVIMAVLALTGFACVVAMLASMFVRHEQARTAADLAALAAAQTQDCASAAEAARRNFAELASCELSDSEARVTISTPTLLGRLVTDVGAPRVYRASAHAAI